jgi:hypothetical protein
VNFVRVLIGLVFSVWFWVPQLVFYSASGGESRRDCFSYVSGCSKKAQCIGKLSYLDPNRNTMQKPIGGLSASALHRHAKVEPLIPPLNKGAIVSESTTV